MADFYAARSRLIPPLPWPTFAPPFSHAPPSIYSSAFSSTSPVSDRQPRQPSPDSNLAGLQAVNVILKFTGTGKTVEILQVKYLNNILEQDHRFIKKITASMRGFKAFHSAAATLAGIETAHMIRKGQFGENGLSAFQQFVALAA